MVNKENSTVGYTSFEDLEVYKKTISFTAKLFKVIRSKEIAREYALSDQIKRATLSVLNNIAEGFERETDKEYIRFLYYSKASAGEVRNILNVMKETRLLERGLYEDFRASILEISKQLSNYIKYIKRRNNNS